MPLRFRIIITCDDCGCEGPVLENGRVVKTVDEDWRCILEQSGPRHFCPECRDGALAEAMAKRVRARFN